MSSYTNPVDFAAWPGAKHIAEACSPKDQPIAKPALMDALLRGITPTGTWSASELAIANAALANCQAACNQADVEIDAILVVAGYSAPLAPAPPLLTEIGKAKALFLMHPDLRINSTVNAEGQHPIHARNAWADKQLEDIKHRRISLGPTDPNPPSAGGGPAYFGGEERFFKRQIGRS